MEHNPYTPPQAAAEISFLREVVPRPIAVWLAILFFLAFGLLFVTMGAQFLGAALVHRGEIRHMGWLAASIVWRLMLIAICLTAAYCIYSRRPWSRWLGLLALTGFGTAMLLNPDSTHYANDAERTGGQFGRYILIPLLMVWWVYAFGFSAKAKRYFSKSTG